MRKLLTAASAAALGLAVLGGSSADAQSHGGHGGGGGYHGGGGGFHGGGYRGGGGFHGGRYGGYGGGYGGGWRGGGGYYRGGGWGGGWYGPGWGWGLGWGLAAAPYYYGDPYDYYDEPAYGDCGGWVWDGYLHRYVWNEEC